MKAPGRPAPTTFELIEAHALSHPDRPALIDERGAVSFGQFHRELIRVTRMLAAIGVQRGQRVAVSRVGWQLELMLLIACENVGAASCSFIALASQDADMQAMFKLVDWVLSEREYELPPPVKFVRVGARFVAALEGIDPDDGTAYPRVALEPHEPQRITRTSGSTGRSKFMLVTRRSQEYWIQGRTAAGRYNRHSRLLLIGPKMINTSYVRSCGCLRAGGAVVEVAAEHLGDIAPTHVWSLPGFLEQFLDALSPSYRSPGPADVVTGGGPMSVRLRQRVRDVFGGEVVNRLGGNEYGWACDAMDASGEGWLSAGVDVRILDDAGRDLPLGEYGKIALRTPGMVDGYLNNDEAGAAAFQGGWFHSGDWGALVRLRRLHLAGRFDDLLNFGGVKLPAARLEEIVRKMAQVVDCAALAVNGGSGDTMLGIALVIDEDADREDVLKRADALIVARTRVHPALIVVDGLPMMANGKLDRLRLSRMFLAGNAR